VWVGRFEPEKDPLLALGALEMFMGEGPGRVAVMLGNGSLHDRVLEGRHACVHIPGAVSRTEVASAMAESDVALITSHFEGSPVVMSEALASGTPVVATRESDPDERIVDGVNGYCVIERSPSALASAMHAALGLSRRSCVDSVRELTGPTVVPRLFADPVAPSRGDG
jgi:glycosyltransferase involved in cell wall biosynthesis